MDTAVFDTLTSLIDKSQNILVLTHAKPDPDGLGASLAMYLVLKEMGKQISVVTNDPMKENMSFLPAINSLQYTLGGTKDFIISLDSSKNAISKIKYNAEEGRVNIIITPKDGVFTPQDVSFRTGKNPYDLVLVFDTGNVEYLGALYEKNVNLFYEVPVVNIDHHASNTDFGKLNIVIPTAASTTEIIYEYLTYTQKKLNKKLITPDVATLLLAGLITDTGSFQHANTTPRSLEVGAELLDLGARQQEIIKNFFKTKKLSTLKLWGQILSRVQVDPLHRMVWSQISQQVLLETEAEPEETEGIIDDLLTNAPGAEVIFLIKQSKPDLVTISMRSTNNGADVGKFCAENGGGGHVRAAGFRVAGTRPFDEVVSEVVRKVREFQAKRLNVHPGESQAPAPEAPKTEVKVDPKPIEKPAQPTEKKVTYLDFGAPKNPSAAEAAKPMETPAKPTPKSDSPKAESAPAPKPIQPKPMASKPATLDQKIVANAAQAQGQPMPKKHHRKRHHKKPNPLSPKPAGNPPPKTDQPKA